MANVNYMNPAGMDPRGDWTPQGFLAGLQYQDRLNDYNRMFGIQSGLGEAQLAQQQAQNEEYRLNAPIRNLQRDVAGLEASYAKQLAPKKFVLEEGDLSSKIDTQKMEHALKVHQLEQAIPEAKRAAAMKEFYDMSDVLQSLPEGLNEATVGVAKQALIRSGFDPDMVSRMQLHELQFIGMANKDAAKDIRSRLVKREEMEHGKWVEQEETRRALEVARINAAAAGRGDKGDRQERLAERALAKMATGDQTPEGIKKRFDALSEGEKGAYLHWLNTKGPAAFGQRETFRAQREARGLESLGVPTQETAPIEGGPVLSPAQPNKGLKLKPGADIGKGWKIQEIHKDGSMTIKHSSGKTMRVRPNQ